MNQQSNDDQYSQQGDYLASLSEDYYYAMHPDPLHPMTDAEREAAIELARSLTYQQNQNTSPTSAKAKPIL